MGFRPDRQALTEAASLFLPVIPFGFVVGLAATEGAIPTGVAWSSSPLIFAGAAQLTVLNLAGSATLWAVVSTAVVINARHVMYSAALAPTFRQQPRWMRWVAPYFLVDQVFALAMARTADPPEVFRRYYLTLAAVFFGGWNATTLLGLVVGPVVPDSWRLEFAPIVMFAGLVVGMCTSHGRLTAALVAAGISALVIDLPNRSGILVAAVAGIVAGALVDLATERRAAARTALGSAP